ncbi:DUF2993 domain-containing protein [Corynebacterium timonense]|nr:DUF2993 domain-containing protein [Corynebacterium timonense]
MKTAWKVVIGVLAAILIIVLLSELGLRAFISNQIRSGIAEESPGAIAAEDTEVSLGSRPILFGLVRGVVPHVSIATPSTLTATGDTYAGQPAATISLDNLRITGDSQVADRFSVTTELPDDYVRALLQEQLASNLEGTIGGSFLQELITVSAVRSNPSEGTFTIDVSGSAASVDLRPTVVDGALQIEAASTSLFGFELPDIVAEGLTNALQDNTGEINAGAIRISEFTVVDGGLRVVAEGEDVDLYNLPHAVPTQDGQHEPGMETSVVPTPTSARAA